MNNWECKRCGKCCLTIPCVFSQVKYQMVKDDGRTCPALIRTGDIYTCKLMETDAGVREGLCDGECDDPALAHLKKKVDLKPIVREYFPDAGDDEIDLILWNHTGFPCFWSIPRDGWTPIQCLRKQLRELKADQCGVDKW